MIYIYTISSDQSCNYIIDWLIKLKVHYKRVFVVRDLYSRTLLL